MLRTSSEHIPQYGQSDQTLEKHCKPCKPVSKTANPGPNRIVVVPNKTNIDKENLIMNYGIPYTSQRRLMVLCLFLFWLSTPSLLFGQDGLSPLEEIKWQQGPCISDLGDVAKIRIPAGYIFTDGDGARIVMEASQNISSGTELGLIATAASDWFLLFEFDDVGYIKDDEKSSLDAGAMLKSIKAANDAANKAKKKRGWPVLDILGWEQPPKYNDITHNLEWAIRAVSYNDPIINYNTRLLGRRGVMSVVIVESPENLNDTLPKAKNIIDTFTFNAEHDYSAFRSGDKIAKYGLTALVVGGAASVAVKSGLFKWIWKGLVVCALGIAGFFKSLFKRKKIASSE